MFSMRVYSLFQETRQEIRYPNVTFF